MRPASAAAVLFLLAAGPGLAACGESAAKPDTAEAFIRGVVTRQLQARVASVTCPEDYETDAGSEFTCVVRGVDGSKGDVDVTQKEKAVLAVNAPFLGVREAEAVMTRQIERRKKLDDVAVDCPEIVVLEKGALITCKVTSGGVSRDVNVRLTDEKGHFRYRAPDFG